MLQGHVDLVRRPAHIFGGKALFDMVVIDVHRGMYRRVIQFVHAGPAAPRQEIRVILHAIHQLEHLLGAVRHQYRFFHQSHSQTLSPIRAVIPKAGRIA